MFKIVNNERLSDNMFRVTFEAPLVARKAQPGQFLMFRVDEFGERMPITISSYDREAGTVTGDHGFEMRPGAGDDKIAQRLGERHHRRASVAGFRAFTGDDDGTRINTFRRNARSLILLQD